MKRRDFAKAVAGIAVGVVASPRVFASEDLAMREMCAAFIEGAREVSRLNWSPQVADFGQSWLKNRLSESSVNYLTIRDAALARARAVGRDAAAVAEADGKAEIQVRHLQEALRRLGPEGSGPTPMAEDCPFGN
jgi:hypothetical protein